MSLDKFQSIERFDGKTIAESEAELSASEKYILWTDENTTSDEREIHIQRLDRDFLSDKDEALIETIADEVYGTETFIGNDGHAFVSVKRWENPEGELVEAEQLVERLLEVF